MNPTSDAGQQESAEHRVSRGKRQIGQHSSRARFQGNRQEGIRVDVDRDLSIRLDFAVHALERASRRLSSKLVAFLVQPETLLTPVLNEAWLRPQSLREPRLLRAECSHRYC